VQGRHKITHIIHGYYEKSILNPELDISSYKLYLQITQDLCNMGSQLPKSHTTQEKQKDFWDFKKF